VIEKIDWSVAQVECSPKKEPDVMRVGDA
jgi:hypothetical protein